MIYNSHHDYLFVHIQKTAGTSISKFLLENAHSHYVSPSHIRLRDLIFLGPKRPFIFAVVRNPWERLVSWYEMMIRKGIHNDFSRYLLTPSSKNRVDQPVGFSEFIRRTDVITENTLPESQRQINNTNSDTLKDSPFHFQDNFTYTKSLSYNQLDYLCSADGNLLFDAALSFETLENSWPVFYRRFDHQLIDYSLPKLNARPSHQAPWQSYYHDCGDISWVAKLYQADIEYFGFKYPH